ncbi:uncharacterized protein ASCRUDRAFT_8266 [Ascoidea rubescens DSM 1968]|uniref:Uncharacterized protein n=1 Tax=Ascoidea rubescens DSM 1968 TaxID=1344418 RepID=A0A1D2VGP4_9ASCO|nr:hypothetical protein ASCRUDRAFT_8266 [Ascoidea rubescens DSM 1968]ODV60647.1 hypothetical protein ASCRUDRAFT_8266 [Ascoidea rubescens DSM 1968]
MVVESKFLSNLPLGKANEVLTILPHSAVMTRSSSMDSANLPLKAQRPSPVELARQMILLCQTGMRLISDNFRQITSNVCQMTKDRHHWQIDGDVHDWDQMSLQHPSQHGSSHFNTMLVKDANDRQSN